MDSLEITFLKQKLEDMEHQFSYAQQSVANHARNALVALGDDDIDEVRKILNALAGNDDKGENDE
jgi:cobalamin biosynthesis protein CobD/CbiB